MQINGAGVASYNIKQTVPWYHHSTFLRVSPAQAHSTRFNRDKQALKDT